GGRPLHLGYMPGPGQYDDPGPAECARRTPGHPGVDDPVVAAVDDERRSADPRGVAPQRGTAAAQVFRDDGPGAADQYRLAVTEPVPALDLGDVRGDTVRVHART